MPDGRNRQVLDLMLESVGLELEDEPLAEAARSLAAEVDRRPGASSLWARYLDTLSELRSIVADRESQVLAEAMRALREAEEG